MATVAIVALFLGGPSPPRRIVLATGQPGGMYDRFGTEYVQRLRPLGLEVRPLATNGSVENLERLQRREVDVAFVQSGTSHLVPDPQGRLRAIAALYLEPLWVFRRARVHATSISDFAGRRIGVGPAGSGTEAVARALLREHGVDGASEIVTLTSAEQRTQLIAGQLDVAFFVTSYRDPLVTELLAHPDVQPLAFPRPAVYVHRLRGLSALTLVEGILSLRDHLPARDTPLLAASALLVSHADLHPRAVELMLKVAQQIHAPGSLIDAPQRYPSLHGIDVPAHEAADVYLNQGESILSRTLPYGLLRWAVLLRVLIISLVVWIPLVRLLPEISTWRCDRRLSHLYATLRGEESVIAACTTAEELEQRLRSLASLGATTEALASKFPGSRHRDLYHWRAHVAFVRAEAAARLAELRATEIPRPSTSTR